MKSYNYLKTLKLHEILFYIFVFLIPIQTRIIFNPAQAYIDWFFSYDLAFFVYLTDLLFFTIIVSCLIFDKTRINFKKPVVLLFFSLFLLGLLSLFHVKQINIGVYKIIKLGEFIGLFYYIIANFKEKHWFHNTFLMLFISGIFQSIIAIWQFHMQHGLNLFFLGEYIAPLGTSGLATFATQAGKIIRAYGTFPHPNVLAGFLVVSFIAGLFWVSRETSTKPLNYGKIATFFGLILIIFAIFFSFSRIAWLTIALIMLAFIFYNFKNRKILGILGLITFVSCATILLAYNNYLFSRVQADPLSVSLRGMYNHLAWEQIQKQPLIGTGPGNYLVNLLQDVKLQPWQYQPPHNIFLMLTAEFGLVGIILFVAMLVVILKKLLWHFGLLPRFLIVMLVALLFLGNFDHYLVTIQQGSLLLFLVLGMAAAGGELKSHNDQEPMTKQVPKLT